MPRFFNPPTVREPFNPYSHGAEVRAGGRLIFLAGQVGVTPDGTMPPDFESQTENTYRNIEAILKDAGMGFENIVKLTTFIVDPDDLPKMREIRKSFLGDPPCYPRCYPLVRLLPRFGRTPPVSRPICAPWTLNLNRRARSRHELTSSKGAGSDSLRPKCLTATAKAQGRE